MLIVKSPCWVILPGQMWRDNPQSPGDYSTPGQLPRDMAATFAGMVGQFWLKTLGALMPFLNCQLLRWYFQLFLMGAQLSRPVLPQEFVPSVVSLTSPRAVAMVGSEVVSLVDCPQLIGHQCFEHLGKWMEYAPPCRCCATAQISHKSRKMDARSAHRGQPKQPVPFCASSDHRNPGSHTALLLCSSQLQGPKECSCYLRKPSLDTCISHYRARVYSTGLLIWADETQP